MATAGDLEGELTIEGPLLEAAYTAFSITKGEEIVPRKETLGIIHDLLIRGNKGYVFCELNGGNTVSKEKISLFRDDVIALDSLLKDKRDVSITEARFIALLPRTEWSPEASKLMEEVTAEFRNAGIVLKIVEPKRLIYDLVVSSALGFILYDNGIIFVGPERWSIRYDSSVSKFAFAIANVNHETLRSLPQSFFPKDYWNERYQDLFVKYADLSKETVPDWLSWSFPNRFGISWKSQDQLLEAVEGAFESEGGEIAVKGKEGFVAVERVRKNVEFTVNVVHKSEMMSSADAAAVNEAFKNLVDQLKAEVPEAKDAQPKFKLFVDTVTFIRDFWTDIKFIGGKGDPIYSEIFRGEDVLLHSLNMGVIGLKLEGNKIRLTMDQGPNVLNIVRGGLQWEASKEGTYPATLKF